MNRKGFALFEIVVVLSIVAILVGGGFYFNSTQNQKSIVQTGNDAIQKAKELQQQSQSQANQEGDAINQLTKGTSSSTTSTTLSKRPAALLAPSSSAELPVCLSETATNCRMVQGQTRATTSSNNGNIT